MATVVGWRRLTDPVVRAVYADLHAVLLGKPGMMTEREVNAALNLLCRLAGRANADGSADVRGWSGARDDWDRVRAAWQAMCAGWRRRHTVRARTRLARALAAIAPALATAVNPLARGGSCRHHRPLPFAAPRSFERTFDLHTCLPARLRAADLPADHPEYALLVRVVDAAALHLRSVSRAHLQRLAAFYDHVSVHRVMSATSVCTAVPPTCPPCGPRMPPS